MFAIEFRNERFLKRIYNKSMRELDVFFGLNWEKNKPKVFLVKDRESVDKLLGRKTSSCIAGWVNNTDVFVLDRDNYEKESCYRYSDDEYSRLIKHELAHVFTRVYSGSFNKSIEPDWLWEGMAIYLADRKEDNDAHGQLKEFLKYYSQDDKDPEVYKEAGFAVEFLIKNFGKRKILKLIRSLKAIDSEKEFSKKFEEIYSFELSYENFRVPLKG
jgi:hypothetical protein